MRRLFGHKWQTRQQERVALAPENSRPRWPWLGFVYGTVSIWGLGKYFWQTLIVNLGLFSPCSHVELKAIHYNADIEMGLGTRVEDKSPVEASVPPGAPRVAHLGNGQSWSSLQSVWCLLASDHSPLHPEARPTCGCTYHCILTFLSRPHLIPTSGAWLQFLQRTALSPHRGIHSSSFFLLFTGKVPSHLSGHLLQVACSKLENPPLYFILKTPYHHHG